MPSGVYVRKIGIIYATSGKHWKIKDVSKYKGNTNGFKKGFNGRKGKKHTEISKQKTRETMLKITPKGENHHFWIKDRTKVVGRHNRYFHDPEYKQWRYKVKIRDGFKCKISNFDCKGRLEVHHILGWKDYPELRYDVNNGITLCHFHHPRKRKDEMRLSPYFQELIKV